MVQRTTLTIAAMITAFALVLMGSVAAYLANPPAPAASLPGLDPTAVQQAINERDAAYLQRIQQANDQLRQAYQKQQELAAELNHAYQQPARAAQPRHTMAQPEPTAPPAPIYTVAPDTATRIALEAAPGATLTHAPDLVSFQGMVAYEVTLDRGTLYIDANSGHVLYNGATIAVASESGGYHEDGEHEGGSDDN